MKTMIQAAAVTLFAASAAHAQQAVQWRVQDGGNGHWYQGRRLAQASFISWGHARATAIRLGGDLATLNSMQESTWVFENVASDPGLWSLSMGPWVGALQMPNATEPFGGWQWIDGTPLFQGFPWAPPYQPDDATYCGGNENRVCYWFGEGLPEPANRFADLVETGYCVRRPEGDWVTSAVIEWSADCNNDGIVDFGQILSGQFQDANRNGIPDRVCECLGDLDADGAITGADLGQLLAAWGAASPGATADLNADGSIDGFDLAYMLAGWGPCAN